MPRKAKKGPRIVDLERETDDQDDTEAITEAETAAPTPETDPRKIPRSMRLDPDEFFTFCAQYPDATKPNQQGIMTYVYRLEPVIDRKQTGQVMNNIDKVPGPVTYAGLRAKWGSGRYHLRFTDSSKPGKSKQICDCVAPVNEYTEFPPVLDVAELVDGCVENRSYISGLLAHKEAFRDKEGNLVATDPNRGKPGSNGDVERGIEIAERFMNRSQGDGKLEQRAGEKAVDLLASTTQTILAQALAAKPGGPGTDNTLIVAVLGMLQASQAQMQTAAIEAQKTQLKMFEMMQAQKSGGGGLLDQAEKIVGVMATIREFFGTGGTMAGAAEQPWWQTLLQSIGPNLPQFLASMRQPMQPPPGFVPQQPAPIQQPPQVQQAPATATKVNGSASGIPASQPIPASATTPQAEVLPPEASEIQGQQVRALGSQVISCLERGIPGNELAASIETFYGRTAWANIAGLGAEKITEALKTVPEIWTPLSMMQADLSQFITEFISYGKPEA